jgi:hypothetical protein
MLKAVSAIVCTSGALITNQVLQRNSMRDESATISAQSTAIRPYFNTLMTSYLPGANPTLSDKRPIPDGMMVIRGFGTSKRWPQVAGSSLTDTRLSLRIAPRVAAS